MTRFLRLVRILFGVGLVLRPSAAQAQCTSGNPATCTVKIQLPVTVDLLKLTVAPVSTSIGPISSADLAAGEKYTTGPTATVKANHSYTVTVVGSAATFGYSGSQPNPNKPAGDLKWTAINSGGCATSPGSYTNSANTGATFMTGGVGTSGTSRIMCYRSLWTLVTAAPGSYSLTVKYTLSAP